MAQKELNPLLAPWTAPFEMPPFSEIRPEDFEAAFEFAMAEHWRNVESIGAQTDAPTFLNTIVALEKSSPLLDRVGGVFWNLTSSQSSKALEAVEVILAPKVAAHSARVALHAPLFLRIQALHQKRDSLGLDPVAQRLLERYHLDFVRSGASLEAGARKRFAEIVERLAILNTQFSQNVQADETAFEMLLTREEELVGLPEFARAAARQAARERGHSANDAHVFTLARSSTMPFMTFSERRDLRERLWNAWCRRGENPGPHDNRPLIGEILTLRLEKARLLGYRNYAEYSLADKMAETPGAARELLMKVWEPARRRANQERAKLQQMADELGHPVRISAWDWAFYSEKVRRRDYSIDEAEVKQYFPLESMIAAKFEVATRLFGLTFQLRSDLPTYHPDVQTWEVRDRAGAHLGVFVGDHFSRPYKRGGAWMSEFRNQSDLEASVRPIIINNNNLAKGQPGEPTFLSMDDARTLFHEFGHGLHGLMSRVKYPRLAGTGVLRDFVEFPSQVYEHWVLVPEVLRRYAVNPRTGQRIPDVLIEKLKEAASFNQGFATSEYTASALADLELHERESFEGFDPTAFEAAFLQSIEMPQGVGMRHRLPHFGHLFSGEGYSAGYYVYLWAEVLDADGFAAFEEVGDAFDSGLAKGLEAIYSAGNSRAPMELFVEFRGRKPGVEPLLKKRGLLS